MEENASLREQLKQKEDEAYNEIGKAWQELRRMGYEQDLNVLSVMHQLQNKFKYDSQT